MICLLRGLVIGFQYKLWNQQISYSIEKKLATLFAQANAKEMAYATLQETRHEEVAA
jgi:hypothetical protein